jgi:3-hydroxyisobutyrate dehydrogenase
MSKISESNMKIGFAGLGTMGSAVAQRFCTGVWKVHVYDLQQQAIEKMLPFGAIGETSLSALVSHKTVVFSCLPTPELVEAFWQENCQYLAEGAIAVDLSTIDPATSKRVATLIETKTEAEFAACTLGKTPAMAKAGEIPVFVGGKAEVIEKLTPLFKCMSNVIFDMGSVEGATMFKLISNLIGMTNLAVIAEGYALAKASGINPQIFAEALKTTGGWSAQADIRLNWMMDRDFSPRFTVDLAAKDLRLSINMAATWGIPTPVSASGLSIFSLARANGLGGQDAAAIIEAIMPKKVEEIALSHSDNL